MAAETTVDAEEIARFSAIAEEWWDPDGRFRPLHRFNPVRLAYIRDRVAAQFGGFDGLRLLDIGCGGGLVAEPMARLGANVVAVDAAPRNIAVAHLHAERMGLAIDYRCTTAEALAAAGERFDVVLNLEVVEHVADRDLYLGACAELLKPGGLTIVATLNRTLKAFALAIVGAEYVLNWLPRGTHTWDKFVQPHELARSLRRAGLAVIDVQGLSFDPLQDEWRRSRDLGVNYLMAATRGAPPKA
jgi:2-polyprenyl-6-hydroxyphenyl methylase / 3-demethylubiquinone-9 3-methyltransferase